MSNCSRDCLTFTKLRPFDDWSKFKWFVQVGDNDLANQGAINENEDLALPDLIRPSACVDEPMIDDFNSSQIECPVCTFLNELTASTCDMCQSNLK